MRRQRSGGRQAVAGRYAISGGQPIERMKAALLKALEEGDGLQKTRPWMKDIRGLLLLGACHLG